MASARGASPTKSGGGDIGDGGDDFGLDFSELCAGGPSETASVVVTGAKRLRETLRQKGFGSPVKRRSTGAASEQDSRPEESPAVKAKARGRSSGAPPAPTPSPKKAAKGTVKGQRKGGKGKRYCKGCGLYFDINLFDPNDPYCPFDRPAMKRMQRMANAQGKQELFKSIKSDPIRLQNCLVRYKEVCGDELADVGTRLPPFKWTQYEEYEKCEQQVRRRKKGVMMHEELSLCFC